ncbi:cytochrome P450 [Aspergillus pseudonomiae]|uniref:Cytochrome P450 n=1 Tax=Aspergillus pseudonomiae TaxID=1506151 RepID=A0A5N6HM53_9EURO|nr:cytochrome P450 [Aspergillus pseudonomiae]KAB8253793.1 cytochrome P450 [Aspergillus pseudonomiae]KAE8397499.1 cytochrome P450 [Aspergillus pseudonomiae]
MIVPEQLSLVTALPVVVVIYAFYWIFTSILHNQRARRMGCKPAFVRPSKLPFGVDILKRYIDAAKDQILQNDELVLYEEMGRHPTWNENLLGHWHHVTADPKNVQAILATQFKDFELGPLRRNLFGPVIGKGIFTTDGKEWQHSRTLLRPQFARSQIADLRLEERHVQHLLDRLPVQQDSWTDTVDLSPLFFNLTLDSATEFLFGHSVHSQINSANGNQGLETDKPTPRSLPNGFSFGKTFDRANQTVVMRSYFLDLYFLYNPPHFRKDCADIQEFAKYYVNLALRGELQPGKGKSAPGESGYVFLQELVKETRDPEELRSQLLNILLAGRDTTAGLLGWTFYLLSRHPEIYKRLRTVVLDTFGDFSSTAAVTFESLKSCSYLQHVMHEVLRLHPVVPENSRRAVRNTTLPRGGGADGTSPIYIRKGEEVAYNVHIMHRREDLWGTDANEFRPDRWSGRRPGWEFIPFNGGPRICLGQQFALTEAGYVIVRMLQRFDKVENMDMSTVVKHKYTSTTAPVQALVRLHTASS